MIRTKKAIKRRAWYKKNKPRLATYRHTYNQRPEVKERRRRWCRAHFKKHAKRIRKGQRDWAIRTHGSVQRYYESRRVLKKYGLTIDEFERLRDKRKHRCDLCKQKCNRLFLDHHHGNGQLRGFLCISCNRCLIGIMESKKVSVKMIAAYLKRRLK